MQLDAFPAWSSPSCAVVFQTCTSMGMAIQDWISHANCKNIIRMPHPTAQRIRVVSYYYCCLQSLRHLNKWNHIKSRRWGFAPQVPFIYLVLDNPRCHNLFQFRCFVNLLKKTYYIKGLPTMTENIWFGCWPPCWRHMYSTHLWNTVLLLLRLCSPNSVFWKRVWVCGSPSFPSVI